ncbi:MAG: arginine deiminase-related protein [Methylocystis sp.]
MTARAGEEEAVTLAPIAKAPERREATPGQSARTPASRERLLMCAPAHYGVAYAINPWMEHQIGKADNARAARQWNNLAHQLASEAELSFVAPSPSLPDMVFTANAGLAIAGTVVVSHFAKRERRPEERLFRDWFERAGFEIAPWPEGVAFEGAGDALVDRSRSLIWCGHGWRSSPSAGKLLERLFARRVVSLRLVDPRFYHLDTCFCPLADGWLLYYPPAFDAASRQAIVELVPAEKRIEVDESDARRFACNAVEASGRVFMNDASPALRRRLRDAGFDPVRTDLSEFIRAGGAAKCLTLRLWEP